MANFSALPVLLASVSSALIVPFALYGISSAYLGLSALCIVWYLTKHSHRIFLSSSRGTPASLAVISFLVQAAFLLAVPTLFAAAISIAAPDLLSSPCCQGHFSIDTLGDGRHLTIFGDLLSEETTGLRAIAIAMIHQSIVVGILLMVGFRKNLYRHVDLLFSSDPPVYDRSRGWKEQAHVVEQINVHRAGLPALSSNLLMVGATAALFVALAKLSDPSCSTLTIWWICAVSPFLASTAIFSETFCNVLLNRSFGKSIKEPTS